MNLSKMGLKAYKGNEAYAFVSYAHNDSHTVGDYVRELQKHNARLWFDEGIKFGNEWPAEIEERLNNAELCIVFYSKSANASKNVRDEINYARTQNIKLYICYIEDTILTDGMGLRIGSIQSHNLYEHIFEENIYSILNILKSNNCFGETKTENMTTPSEFIKLDYNGRLLLEFSSSETSWLTNKIFYKINIKNKIDEIKDNIYYFNPKLNYIDYEKIDELLSSRVPGLGKTYICTPRLKTFIKDRNYHIEKRSKLGIELKTDDTNLQEKYELFENIVDKNMTRKLREKQMKDAFFMLAMLKSANFSVPGSGKTTSALAVFAFLNATDKVKRIVMIGPKNSFGSWIDEFKICFKDKKTLKLFNIQNSNFKTINERKYALKYETGNCNLFLFNYESLDNYTEELKEIIQDQSLLVFDEVHKVKGINGQRANNALEISSVSKFTIAMTGTPIPNSYLDLYNLLHILYNDEYKDFFGFDTSYLKNAGPRDISYINKKIQPFFCRTTKKQLMVPEANPDIIETSNTTNDEQKLFKIIKNKYIQNHTSLFIRLLQLESNPKLLLNKIDISEFEDIIEESEDFSDVNIIDYSQEVKDLVNNIQITSKKQKCLDTAIKLVKTGKKIIIWCILKDSINNLQLLLSSYGIKSRIIMGEVELDDRIAIIDDFKKGEFDVLITNPHTLAESVSLHQICHDAIYFEYSYNLVHLLQSKDRIHRLGLPDNQYTQYYFIQQEYVNHSEPFSMDKNVYERLLLKEKIMLNAIDNQELEPVYTTKEDLDIIFKGLL